MCPAHVPVVHTHSHLPDCTPHMHAMCSQVSAEDAVEGMAYYIAAYLSRSPEARAMDPAALQAALAGTLAALRRSRYAALWAWGRVLYRAGAISASVYSAYTHPWLARALVAAIWSSGRMAAGYMW